MAGIHVCKKEGEIGEITAILGRISKDVYGNGNEGLVKTIPRLEEKINNLVGSVASHTNVISSFIEFQATHNGEIRSKKELEERAIIAHNLDVTQKRDRTQKAFLFIMAGLVLGGLIINAYFGFVNSKKSGSIVTKVDNLGEPVVTRGGQTLSLPPDVKIKFFPKDFDSARMDTTIK